MEQVCPFELKKAPFFVEGKVKIQIPNAGEEFARLLWPSSTRVCFQSPYKKVKAMCWFCRQMIETSAGFWQCTEIGATLKLPSNRQVLGLSRQSLESAQKTQTHAFGSCWNGTSSHEMLAEERFWVVICIVNSRMINLSAGETELCHCFHVRLFV